MKQFEVGKIYSCRSNCDYNCIWDFKVISRTEKFITIQELNKSEVKRVKCFNYRLPNQENEECVFPLGEYSTAPILRMVIKEFCDNCSQAT